MRIPDIGDGARPLGRGTRRFLKSKRTFGVLAAAATLAIAIPATSFANTTATLPGSTFEGGDGNLTVDVSGHTDWCTDFPAPAATATCTTPITGLHTGIDNASGSTDNAFGQGTKEDNSTVTVVSGSIPPNKSDLTRFYEASELGSNNHVFLYLAWERTNNLGNANMDFEINQNNNGCPNTPGTCTISRTNGDILVTYDFSGSGTPTLGILRWLVAGQQNPDQIHHPGLNNAGECFSSNTLPCWGDHEDLNGTDSQGAVDTGTSGVVDPINPGAPRTIVQNGFGEAAIDLTAAGVITQSNGCVFGQATTFLKSRSASSFTSEIKDFISPVKTPLFQNCGALAITKTNSKTGHGLPGATFSITGPNGYSNTVTSGSNGTVCVDNLVTGSYTVTETAAPSGYSIDTSPQTVSVGNGTCASGAASVSFSDTPLTDITATATSEVAAPEGTNSTITCVSGTASSTTNVGNSPQPPTGTSPSPSVSATGLAPGTYTCTIVIDP
jgi:hypothetical protein